jgi:hypothetical protein
MKPTNLFDYRLKKQLDLTAFHPDFQQLMSFLFDENFPCTGAMAGTNIQTGIKSLREIFCWNRIEIIEGDEGIYEELESKVVQDNFLRVIFHLPEKNRFFCFSLGKHNRDFLFRVRCLKHYSESDIIVALFRGANNVLEVVFYPGNLFY